MCINYNFNGYLSSLVGCSLTGDYSDYDEDLYESEWLEFALDCCSSFPNKKRRAIFRSIVLVSASLGQ